MLGFAVGMRGIVADRQMPQASAALQAREPIGDVPAAVVTHYAADAGPWRRKIRATIEPPRCNA